MTHVPPAFLVVTAALLLRWLVVAAGGDLRRPHFKLRAKLGEAEFLSQNQWIEVCSGAALETGMALRCPRERRSLTIYAVQHQDQQRAKIVTSVLEVTLHPRPMP